MNKAVLKKLGFADKEVDVYVALLKRGRATPAEIAKMTKINRATVYVIAKKLSSRGIVSEDLAGKSLYLVAHPPENLEKSLVQEKKALEEKQKLVHQAVAELSHVPKHSVYPVPKIRFIEEDRLGDFLYEQVSEWDRSAHKHDGIWWGFQDHTLVESYKKWIDWSWKKVTTKSKIKLFTNQSPIESQLRGIYAGRQMRFWDNAKQFTATTWVIGDYLVMVYTHKEPHYLVEIHDATLAHNMREVFKKNWEEKS